MLQLALPKNGRRSIHVTVAEDPQAAQLPPQSDTSTPVGGAEDKKMEEVTVEVENDSQ